MTPYTFSSSYIPELPYDKHSTFETIQDTSAVEECTFSN